MNTPTLCQCYDQMPAGSSKQELGIDETNGRYGEVTVSTCIVCGRRWLFYFAEYEGFTASQRWIRGILPASQGVPFPPQQAVPILNKMKWYFYRFSQGETQCGRANAPADLASLGGEPVEINFSEDIHEGTSQDNHPITGGVGS